MLSHIDDHEQRRLAALARYAVIGTLPETTFDRLASLAAQFFHAPIALISLVDEDSQFFKACLGLDLRSTDRSLSFCAHALQTDAVMIVPDAAQDTRFADNGLVTGHPHIRFYIGAPLETPDGYRLGTLCIIDTQPRTPLTAQEQNILKDLAALVMDELELRLRTLELEREAQANQQLLKALKQERRYGQSLLSLSQLAELRPGTKLYRLGGDEFVVLDLRADRLEADVWQQDVLAAVDAAVAAVRLANFGAVGASVGMATGWESDAAKETLKLADQRMYAEKRARRQRSLT